MTAQTDKLRTLDEVVGDNIKRLRISRHWRAEELAEKLTSVLERPYTRFTVADLEGRRKREIRWTELAALCSVFNVALWDLVLPPEGVEVDSPVATGGVTGADYTDTPSDDPELAAIGATKATIWYEYPARDDLAWRFFSIDSETLVDGGLQHLRKQHETERRLAAIDALLPVLPKRFGWPPRNKTAEEEGQ